MKLTLKMMTEVQRSVEVDFPVYVRFGHEFAGETLIRIEESGRTLSVNRSGDGGMEIGSINVERSLWRYIDPEGYEYDAIDAAEFDRARAAFVAAVSG